MKFEKKHAWLLIGVALWNFVTWAMFAKNLASAHSSGEDRPTGYWVAHSVLIVANVIIGVVLGSVGLKALRAGKESPAGR